MDSRGTFGHRCVGSCCLWAQQSFEVRDEGQSPSLCQLPQLCASLQRLNYFILELVCIILERVDNIIRENISNLTNGEFALHKEWTGEASNWETLLTGIKFSKISSPPLLTHPPKGLQEKSLLFTYRNLGSRRATWPTKIAQGMLASLVPHQPKGPWSSLLLSTQKGQKKGKGKKRKGKERKKEGRREKRKEEKRKQGRKNPLKAELVSTCGSRVFLVFAYFSCPLDLPRPVPAKGRQWPDLSLLVFPPPLLAQKSHLQKQFEFIQKRTWKAIFSSRSEDSTGVCQWLGPLKVSSFKTFKHSNVAKKSTVVPKISMRRF